MPLVDMQNRNISKEAHDFTMMFQCQLKFQWLTISLSLAPIIGAFLFTQCFLTAHEGIVVYRNIGEDILSMTKDTCGSRGKTSSEPLH